jgi:hypothetical protein
MGPGGGVSSLKQSDSVSKMSVKKFLRALSERKDINQGEGKRGDLSSSISRSPSTFSGVSRECDWMPIDISALAIFRRAD